MEDKDLFSYANSNDVVDSGESSFDLNAFSSKSVSKNNAKPPKKKVSKKVRIFRAIIASFLICVILGVQISSISFSV